MLGVEPGASHCQASTLPLSHIPALKQTFTASINALAESHRSLLNKCICIFKRNKEHYFKSCLSCLTPFKSRNNSQHLNSWITHISFYGYIRVDLTTFPIVGHFCCYINHASMNMLSFYMLLGMEYKGWCILGRYSITKLHRPISPKIYLLLYTPQVFDWAFTTSNSQCPWWAHLYCHLAPPPSCPTTFSLGPLQRNLCFYCTRLPISGHFLPNPAL